MSFVESPANFRERQCMREDQVTALPCGLKLLFEVKQRLTIFQIPKTVSQYVNPTVQKGGIFAICIAQWSQTQADHLRPTILQEFNRARKQKFHCARCASLGSAHKVKPPSLTPIDGYERNKCMYKVMVIDRQRSYLFRASNGIELTHTKTHLGSTFLGYPSL